MFNTISARPYCSLCDFCSNSNSRSFLVPHSSWICCLASLSLQLPSITFVSFDGILYTILAVLLSAEKKQQVLLNLLRNKGVRNQWIFLIIVRHTSSVVGQIELSRKLNNYTSVIAI